MLFEKTESTGQIKLNHVLEKEYYGVIRNSYVIYGQLPKTEAKSIVVISF